MIEAIVSIISTSIVSSILVYWLCDREYDEAYTRWYNRSKVDLATINSLKSTITGLGIQLQEKSEELVAANRAYELYLKVSDEKQVELEGANNKIHFLELTVDDLNEKLYNANLQLTEIAKVLK